MTGLSNACSWRPGSVTLIDGRAVPSDSPEWMAECEARRVLRLRTKLERRMWVFNVEKRRGKESADKLYRNVMRVFEHENSVMKNN